MAGASVVPPLHPQQKSSPPLPQCHHGGIPLCLRASSPPALPEGGNMASRHCLGVLENFSTD